VVIRLAMRSSDRCARRGARECNLRQRHDDEQESRCRQKVAGSVAVTWNSRRFMTRVSANAPPMPTREPASEEREPWPRTRRENIGLLRS